MITLPRFVMKSKKKNKRNNLILFDIINVNIIKKIK